MKISEIKSAAEMIQYIEEAQKSKQPEKNQITPSPEVKSQQIDRVDLSAESKEIKKIYTLQQMAPDIRVEQVDAVRKLVQENRYQVNSEAVAEKIIRESIFELNR